MLIRALYSLVQHPRRLLKAKIINTNYSLNMRYLIIFFCAKSIYSHNVVKSGALFCQYCFSFYAAAVTSVKTDEFDILLNLLKKKHCSA